MSRRSAGTLVGAFALAVGCGQTGVGVSDDSGELGTESVLDVVGEGPGEDSADAGDSAADDSGEPGDIAIDSDDCEALAFESTHGCLGWGAIPELSYPPCLLDAGDVWVIHSRECLDEVLSRAGECCFGGGSCCERQPPWLEEIDFGAEQVVAIDYTWHDFDSRCPTAGLLCFPRLSVTTVNACGGCLCVSYVVEEDPCVGPDVSCPDAPQLPLALVRTPRIVPVCLAPCGEACASATS